MLVSRKDLEKLVDIADISTERLSELYNNYGGLEVEGIERIVPQNKYIIGKITSFHKHPDADKLNVCLVDTGTEVLEIVCGAPNVATDKYVIVALVGTTMPNGMTIEKREVRGVASCGMLCSLQEIGLDDKYVDVRYKDGIFFFEDYQVTLGADVLTTLGFDTEIFDLSLTPDRADCLSYRGLAYETAALTQKQIIPNTFLYEAPQGSFSINEYITKLDVISDKVIAYNLIAYRNINIKPSPQWMQSFLIANGVRPISNVVDITNYVMLMLGLPIHAFDGDKLPEKQIVVRQANENETHTTLDGKERQLTPTDIVISTGNITIGLAGVMGGENTEIDHTTSTVILEAAIFNPVAIRKTAVKFDLRSDASQRFEKGVDPTLPALALALTSKLMVELADAEVSTDILSMATTIEANKAITCTYQEIAKRIGIDLTSEEIIHVLERLSFEIEPKSPTAFTVTAPTWRRDIHIFEDIVEEVARIYGFEHLPNKLPIDVARPVFKSTQNKYFNNVHETMQAFGLQEILTYTLASNKLATFGQYKNDLTPVKILYPLNNDRETLRTTTYYSMLEVLQYHANRSFTSAAFYEITEVYGVDACHKVLAFGGYGAIEEQKLYQLETEIDFYLLKAWFEGTLLYTPTSSVVYQATENEIFHPGIAADIYIDETYIGTFGKIHPQIANQYDLNKNFYFGEVNIETIFALEKKYQAQTAMYEQITKFPTIERDLALVMQREMPIGDLLTAIRSRVDEHCKDIKIFDIYTGEHIDSTKKSVALHLTFNSQTETLTNEYISEVIEQLLTKLANDLNITLRK